MNVFDQAFGENYAMYHGDCVGVAKGLPDSSIHFSVFSPPFSQLYVYSDSENDMGNCANDDEFFQHFDFLISELHRVTIPGRLCAVHCKQLVNYKGRDGMAGLRDFRGEIIRHFIAAGWAYHSEVCIWKDPVIEQERTKAHGLLHNRLLVDSTVSRQGLPDYLVVFRRWPESEEEADKMEPVSHAGTCEEDFGMVPPDAQHIRPWPKKWQRYASPVWFDIEQTNVLNIQQARESQDEKQICLLQLDVIKRALELWTNPGDLVFDPFMGIGSTGYVALELGRKALGCELKRAYFEVACKNLEDMERLKAQPTLCGFSDAELEQAS